MPAGSKQGVQVIGLQSPLAGPFDLELEAGRTAVIRGASGSGKSLFLRMIADLDPNVGDVNLNGLARSSMSGPHWRRMSPYVAADSGWWSDRVSDHFAPGDQGMARELATRLGVEKRAFVGAVSQLSTGERQRIALVRAFILKPPLILLDEPTGPLDPEAVQKFEALLLEKVGEGMSAVVVSHDPEQGARLGARRLEMVDRKLTVLA